MSRTIASLQAAARKQRSERRIELVRQQLRRMEAAAAPSHVPSPAPSSPGRGRPRAA